MHSLILLDSNKKLFLRQENIVIKNFDGIVEDIIAIDTVSSVNVYSNAQFSTQLLKALAKRGVEVHFFTKMGSYVGSFGSKNKENYEKQVQQFRSCSQTSFQRALAKRILVNKVQMQMTLIRDYDEDQLVSEDDYRKFQNYIISISEADSIEEMIGFEGRAAKNYFYNLNLFLPVKYQFKRRSKRPPKDPFNSLLSFGYSILYGYFRGVLVKYGLNLGIGVIHKNRRHHASLVSDLLEVWRPIIVDEVALRMIIQREFLNDDFKLNPKNNGVLIQKEAKKSYLNQLFNRMSELFPYFEEEKQITGRYAIDLQVQSLQKAFQEMEPLYYKQVRIAGT